RLERAPVVQVFADRMLLDGAQRADDDLEGMLGTLRMNFRLLQPGKRFNGTTIVVAGPDAPMSRVGRVLGAAHDAGCPRPSLTSRGGETCEPPASGTPGRVHAGGARLTLVRPDDDADAYGDEPADARVLLRLADFPRYDAFARKVVALRRL